MLVNKERKVGTGLIVSHLILKSLGVGSGWQAEVLESMDFDLYIICCVTRLIFVF